MVGPYYILVVLCLVGAPRTQANCYELSPDATAPTGIMCVIAGHELAKRWLVEHPAYEIERIECDTDRPDGDTPA